MENNKSPGNDGLSKEFCECFWDEIKNPFLASIHGVFLNHELSSSQKQAVIKMLEKKDKDERFIKNWRPISLLNTDMEITSKVLSTRIKNVLPFLISSNQMAYVKSRFISESGRMIYKYFRNIKYTRTRRFSSHSRYRKKHLILLIIASYCKFFENLVLYFVSWIKKILKNQEFCIINGGKTTKYFELERGARQGDPISAYLFILALEILFIFVENNPKVKSLKNLRHELLYTAYANITFFLKDRKSIIELMS